MSVPHMQLNPCRSIWDLDTGDLLKGRRLVKSSSFMGFRKTLGKHLLEKNWMQFILI